MSKGIIGGNLRHFISIESSLSQIFSSSGQRWFCKLCASVHTGRVNKLLFVFVIVIIIIIIILTLSSMIHFSLFESLPCPFAQIQAWVAGKHCYLVDPESFCKSGEFLRQVHYWLKNFRILCNTKYPDNMLSVQINWKVSGQSKKCPDNLENVSA